MGDYRIPGEKLTAFGDETRRLAAVEGGLTYDQMLELLGGLESANTLTAAENSVFGNVEAAYEYGILDWGTNSVLSGSYYWQTANFFTANENMTVYGMRVAHGLTWDADILAPAALWDIDGNLLASCFMSQKESYVEALFDSPVNLIAGNSYVMSISSYCPRYIKYGWVTNPKITIIGTYSEPMSTPIGWDAPCFPPNMSGSTAPYPVDILIGESATPRPSVYTVQLETMDDIADEVIRITGASTVQTPAQIILALQSEESGGGELQQKTATPKGKVQEVTPDAGFYGLSKVRVEAAKLQQKTVTPTTQAQEVTANSGYYGLSKVVVEAVEVKEIKLQEKTLTPTKNTQSATPDNGYDGLSKVNVGAIPDEYIVPSGTKNIAANGDHNVKTYESVSVDVPIPDGYIQPSGTLNVTQNGEYDVTNYAAVEVEVAGGALQEKTVTPTSEEQVITPDAGYYGLSKVIVKAAEGTVLPDNVGIYYIGKANSVLKLDFESTAIGTLS